MILNSPKRIISNLSTLEINSIKTREKQRANSMNKEKFTSYDHQQYPSRREEILRKNKPFLAQILNSSPHQTRHKFEILIHHHHYHHQLETHC